MDDPGPKINKAMDNLLKLAICNPKVGNHRLASAIYLKNKIIAYGFNSYNSSFIQRKFATNKDRVFLHAEIAAIKNALKFIDVNTLSKCKLLVCRASMKNNKLQWAMAKPCRGCERAIITFGIKKVYFTVDESSIESTRF